MQKVKKSILAILATLFVGIAMYSCGLLDTIDLKDEKSTTEFLRATLEKHIDPEAKIFEFHMGTTSDFSLEMNVISLKVLAPGAEIPQDYSITLPGNQEPRIRDMNPVFIKMGQYSPEGGLKLADMDFSKITSNILKVEELLKEEEVEEGKGLELSGVSFYGIKIVDGDPAKSIHEITTRSKAGTEFGTQNGRAALTTNYYEYNFTADSDGNVTIKE